MNEKRRVKKKGDGHFHIVQEKERGVKGKRGGKNGMRRKVRRLVFGSVRESRWGQDEVLKGTTGRRGRGEELNERGAHRWPPSRLKMSPWDHRNTARRNAFREEERDEDERGGWEGFG